MKLNYRIYTYLILVVSVFSLLLSSCEKENYYETPSWLKGSIYEVLEQEGNYQTFLKGVDLSGFKPMLDGKSILTVMAPNDSAFQIYLREYYEGKKIEDLPKSEITKLIGFHVLYYAFDKVKLTNFRPSEGDGATKVEQNVNAGLYYKFRTKSSDDITLEIDTAGNEVSVYHLDRFLPVFSYRMFQTKQIAAPYNYEYFFPQTPWKGDSGFNISNAAVKNYALIADNGYIYSIDRVLKPLETIYNELASDPDFSEFLELYNAYEYYELDEDLTLEYGGGVDLYQHYHEAPLANIACEWPVTDYRMIDQLALKSFSVFAPNNNALNNFFNEYWGIGGYNTLDEVSKTSVNYLLFNCVYDQSIVFPDEIKKGIIENSYGTVIKFDVDAVPVNYRKICVNGALYGLDVLTPPAMFGSVTGPAFQYKKFSYFLSMLNVSDMVLTLSSDQANFLMLYPSDDLMRSTGIMMDVSGNLLQGTQRISNGAQQNYVFAHVVSLDGTTGNYQSLPSSGTHVFKSLSPSLNLYWYMLDGKITNSVKYNEILYVPGVIEEQLFCSIEELSFRDGWSNGKTYTYQSVNSSTPFILEGSHANAIYPNFIPMMINTRNQASTMYYSFVQLLDKANLIDVESQSVLPVAESSLMFVPVNDAVKQGILDEKIPGIVTSATGVDDVDFFNKCTVTDELSLQYYLLQYFIPLSTAVISNFPYIGWEEDIPAGLPTLQSYDEVTEDGKAIVKTTNMVVTDQNNKLSIRTISSEGIPVSNQVDVIDQFHFFPFVFDDGCIHFIESVL